jgi:membrane-associated phospholipid phosphatase
VRAIFQWLLALLVTVIACTASFFWLDRPIALLAHAQQGLHHHGIFDNFTHIPDPLVPLAVIAFVWLGLRTLGGRPLSNFQATTFVVSLSVICGEAIKDQLKFIFGRTWPETWDHKGPSFIHGGVYGFNFMHGGGDFQSFPSGHMAASCAVLSVLWSYYPKWRPLWTVCAFAAALGLVGTNFHFLSDVIAGAFVGVSAGWMIVSLFRGFGLSTPTAK